MKKKKQKFQPKPESKIKKFQLEKVVISDFQAKKVKGGSANRNCTYDPSGCSDRRYKKNIVALTGALGKIQQLNGVYYHWRTDEFPEKGFGEERTFGLIAQELEAVLPEAVATDDKGYRSVHYGLLTALLVEGVKDQQTQIEELKNANMELREQLQQMQTAIDRLAASIARSAPAEKQFSWS